MIEFVDYEPAHLRALRLQAPQAYFSTLFSEDYAAALAQHPAWAGIVDGQVVGCAGLVEQWTDRALCWALFSEAAGPHFLAITRFVQRVFALFHYRRVEAYVDPNFAEAQRWVRILGFEREGLMRAFTPTGEDNLLFARVRR